MIPELLAAIGGAILTFMIVKVVEHYKKDKKEPEVEIYYERRDLTPLRLVAEYKIPKERFILDPPEMLEREKEDMLRKVKRDMAEEMVKAGLLEVHESDSLDGRSQVFRFETNIYYEGQ